MLERILDPIVNECDLETIGVCLEQFKKDTNFLDAHRDLWKDEYPDQWVVVFGEELVGVGYTVEEAIVDAETKQVPRARVPIDYLSSNPVKMILLGGRHW